MGAANSDSNTAEEGAVGQKRFGATNLTHTDVIVDAVEEEIAETEDGGAANQSS